jgi:arylsulfatase A-like enzyme
VLEVLWFHAADLLTHYGADKQHSNTIINGISGLALRQGDWKYIPATEVSGGMGSGANATDPRFAAANIPQSLLFNLATDPNEKGNIISQYPEKAAELADRLKSIVAKSAATK